MMREFLSKSLAGGLSAAVVLLWWPMLFHEVDSVASWLVRGVAWTIAFELLLLALVPFERALWETARGERITSRVGAAGSRLHSGSRRRRLGRLSGVASVALVVPVALLVMGLQEHAPARAEAKPVKVVHVTKVVRPVTVKRVVERAPISGQPVVTTPAPATPAPAPVPERVTEEPGAPAEQAPRKRTAPVQRETTPAPETAPTPQTGESCEGDACGRAAPPASGSSSS